MHRGLGQESPGGMADREDHRLLVPGGERTSQDFAISGDPVVRRTQLHLYAKVLVNQRVQLHPVHARQESRSLGARDHPGRGVVRNLAEPLNAVPEIAKNT